MAAEGGTDPLEGAMDAMMGTDSVDGEGLKSKAFPLEGHSVVHSSGGHGDGDGDGCSSSWRMK